MITSMCERSWFDSTRRFLKGTRQFAIMQLLAIISSGREMGSLGRPNGNSELIIAEPVGRLRTVQTVGVPVPRSGHMFVWALLSARISVEVLASPCRIGELSPRTE